MVEVLLKNKEVVLANDISFDGDLPFIILKTNSDIILINFSEISTIKVNDSDYSFH